MIAIVTDSTGRLTRQEAKDLGVVCIPMTYTVAGTVYAKISSMKTAISSVLSLPEGTNCIPPRPPSALI